MQNSILLYIGTFLVLFVFSCSDQLSSPKTPSIEKVIKKEEVKVNPSGYAPLTARIDVTTDVPTSVTLKVAGKSEESPDVTHQFEEVSTEHSMPALGLYADYDNIVTLTFHDNGGAELGTRVYHIQTDPLINDMPTVDIQTAQTTQMANGMTLVSYFGHGHNDKDRPQRPFIFDRSGAIRWYLDYSSSPVLSKLFYDVGIERLQNGHLYFGDGSTAAVYEINMLGKIIDKWDLPGYGFHHNVLEKPNGNFLVTVSKNGSDTIEDHVLELDRDTKEIINVWDLRKSLDYDRTILTGGEKRADWIHINAVAYDPSDNTILVSGRTQGVIKLTQDNKVVWIMGPHKDWGTSGNGVDLNQFLLQPLDTQNQPINDQAVLDGDANDPDFEWNWCQHAVKVMPNGHVTIFDNGDQRNYTTTGPYSRAVEYAVDADNMTIKQIWSYGENRGSETYSRIVSDVDYMPKTNHVIFSPGAVNYGGHSYGKAIELDYDTKQVLFEATIRPPEAVYGITFHRTERMSLYP